ncbi:capsid maturation protease [Brevibacterium phage LuckyBarnes]|uniref:Capsid maturation protease n=1 Tax=Brevibacterium phage LuckyBarnes TaxID=2027888 RepID=A0A249XNL5_9CAUD|nr:head maturation protease [Brevibacterium phage LuckyBarnes]ASZ73331.1 capsid maturation protease [Brevibacterium phage LuckyBarnes]
MTILKEAGTVTQKPGGRFKIGVITPGSGSSGTYPRETIEAAGRDKVFAAGTHMYLDHATEADSFQRPEGSIRDLVGVLTEDAYWDDEAGGLVAEARIYSNWRPVLEEMKDDIGVSIRASGEVREDKGQRIITRLSEARSVDFVTRAGRGGRILEVIESARMREASTQDTREQLQAMIPGDSFVRDFDPEAGRVWYETENGTYEQAYTAADGGLALQGEATEVVATTKYVPKTNPAPAGKETAQKEEAAMADTPNDATSRVDEADSKKPTPPNGGGGGGGNETEVEKLRRENAALKAEIAELKKAKAKEARESHVAGIVEEAFKDVEAPTTKRLLIERLSESEDKDDAAILAEAQSIAGETKGIGAGEVHGMGESAPADRKESEQPKHSAEDTVNLLEGSR